MGRKEPAKGIHTSPAKAGAKNLENVKLPKDKSGIMGKLMPIMYKGKENDKTYKGLWNEESLIDQVEKYFEYCFSVELKPTKASLSLWLGVDKSTYWEWETKPEKYGYKSKVLRDAAVIMESYLQSNIDSYPTGSIFLLKTCHNYVEASKLDITTNGQNINSPDEVKDLVSKLGLDKK